MSKRQLRSQQELQEASKHLDYEVQMFFDSVDRLTYAGYQQSDHVLYNGLLTAFTIYTRSLLDFFYASNPRSDDMVAADYYDDPAFWEANRPKVTSLLEKTRAKVGKLSAHLTYTRESTPESERWWIWRDVRTDMQAVITKFVETVPTSRIDPKIRTRLNNP
jgi:hypothetical protein